ncbi:MAG: hypothetical protein KDJ27_01185 [Gammaproteobacteria bacterium]|nr:hypothetical protein [Gammaproteobacteria bacterium]MCB1922353.1 hypothetical protein [Gammaproteobacteria bacterium]
MSQHDDTQLIDTAGLNEYFHRAVHEAADQRHVHAEPATLHYLILMLSDHARSDRLFDYGDGRLQLRPLALLYGDALAATSAHERRLWLQRLGDLALFVGGLFAGRLSRRFSDLDYCVAMGGNAYGYLGQTAPRNGDQAIVFGELAAGFAHFVDLVAIATGRSPVHRDA